VTAWSSSADGAEEGGDWCDVVAISEDTIALTVGDVAGHGEAVAATMASMRASVLRGVHNFRAPSEILSVVNGVACSHGDGVIVTAIVAFLNYRLRTLAFANAGHPPPLLLSGKGEAYLAHRPADVPLGVFPNHRSADFVIALPLDAMLVLYTDGITEHARDPVQGEVELRKAARDVFERPEADAAQAIALQVLRERRGSDDAAVLALRTANQAS
jgi:serine phosphatase RsbU (regulator of sigma subunit)